MDATTCTLDPEGYCHTGDADDDLEAEHIPTCSGRRIVNAYRVGLARSSAGRLYSFRSAGADGDPFRALEDADASTQWVGVEVVDVRTGEAMYFPSATPGQIVEAEA